MYEEWPIGVVCMSSNFQFPPLWLSELSIWPSMDSLVIMVFSFKCSSSRLNFNMVPIFPNNFYKMNFFYKSFRSYLKCIEQITHSCNVVHELYERHKSQ